MSETQKIIKYIAIAFALFLIVSIFSGILFGMYVIFGGTIGISKIEEYDVNPGDLKVIANEVSEISNIKIELGLTNLQIKKGSQFKVETDNCKISYNDNNGDIVIKEKSHNWNFGVNKPAGSLIIYIPEDTKLIDEVKIENGAGTVNIDGLNTENLYLELGAGKVLIENINVTKKLKMDGGAGKTEIKNSEITNLDADLGVGEFILNGTLTGNSDIDSGVGAIKIDLIDDVDNYTIDVSKGVGAVTIDGRNIEKDGAYGNGNSRIKIDGGIGSIEVK